MDILIEGRPWDTKALPLRYVISGQSLSPIGIHHGDQLFGIRFDAADYAPDDRSGSVFLRHRDNPDYDIRKDAIIVLEFEGEASGWLKARQFDHVEVDDGGQIWVRSWTYLDGTHEGRHLSRHPLSALRCKVLYAWDGRVTTSRSWMPFSGRQAAA
ncbi:MAG: hypothetical protein H7841_12785 [Magnetospirillum sp. WYHS-4]